MPRALILTTPRELAFEEQSDTPSWTWPVRNLGYEDVGVIVELGDRCAGRSGLRVSSLIL